MHRREFLALAGATLAAGVSTRAWSQAQSWPERPVKLILPYAPGGATDLIGRPRADKLSQAFGQQLPHDPESRGAERHAQRDLARPRRLARQQEGGDVHAGTQ